MHRKLSVILLLACLSLTSVASGQEKRRADDEQDPIVTAERGTTRRAKNRERKARWRRFDNVRFITASPITRRGGTAKAAPSTGVIEYDNNVAVRRSDNTALVVVGNQFNVGGGGNPIGGPWAISGFVVQNAGPAYPTTTTFGSPTTPTGTVFFFGGPGPAGQAPVHAILTSVTLTGGLQTFSFPSPLTGSGSFLGGVVNSTTTTCSVTSVPPGTPCDGVALDTAQNSTNPLGFHAMSIGAGIPGTSFNTLGNLNAIFKVFGSNLPVELLSFSVETE